MYLYDNVNIKKNTRVDEKKKKKKTPVYRIFIFNQNIHSRVRF